MSTKKIISTITISLLSFFGLFFFGNIALANTDWDDDFETHSVASWTPLNGSLNASPFVSCSRDLTIVSSPVHGGSRALQGDRTGTSTNCTAKEWLSGESFTTGNPSLTFWWAKSEGSSVANYVRLYQTSTDETFGIVQFNANAILDGAGSTLKGSLSTATFYEVTMTLDFVAQEIESCVTGGSCTTIAFATTDPGDSWDAISFECNGAGNHTCQWDDVVVDTGDPRANPITLLYENALNDLDLTIDIPLSRASDIRLLAVSNVLSSVYTDEADATIEFGLTLNSVGVDAKINLVSTCGGSYLGAYCSNYYRFGFPWTVGVYELTARSCFVGFDCGDWSSPYSFEIVNDLAGGGNGSFGGTTQGELDDLMALWGGDYVEWDTFISSYPDHDTVYGACDLWGSDPEDGLTCIWSWISYALFPDADQFTNVITSPLGVLTTRWPIGYITAPASAFVTGLDNGSDVCPIPDLFDSEILGLTVPAFSLCDAFDEADASTVIASNSYASTILPFAIYISFAMLWFTMGRHFLRG